MGPGAGVDAVKREKSLPLTEIEPRSFDVWSSHYSDWAGNSVRSLCLNR